MLGTCASGSYKQEHKMKAVEGMLLFSEALHVHEEIIIAR
jgi:hypothetical protein